MDYSALLISTFLGIGTSVITTIITFHYKMKSERIKWRKEFSIKYAELQADNPITAQKIALQFAVGVLIIDYSKDEMRDKIFIPANTRITAGRAENNELNIKDMAVSKIHCAFFTNESETFVEPLGSSNGTFVNGLRIESPHKLKNKDVITIGTTRIEYDGIAKLKYNIE